MDLRRLFARVLWWLVYNLVSTRITRAFSAVFQLVGPSLYWYLRLFLPRCRSQRLPLLNLMEFLCPFLQPIKTLLNGSMTQWCISHFSQCCIIYNLTEDWLGPILQAVNEDVKQYCPWYPCHWVPLGQTIRVWLLARLCATDYKPLDLQSHQV